MHFNKVREDCEQDAGANPMFFHHCILELGLEEQDYVSERYIGLVETEDSNMILVSFAAITVH